MPNAGSVWDTRTMKSMIAQWYGIPNMPMRILTREEEIEQFETSLPEVPDVLWDLVNHDCRLVRRWASDDCVDLVVWNEPSQSFRLVQDLCFKEEYPDDVAWRKAVYDLIHQPGKKVWVAFHE